MVQQVLVIVVKVAIIYRPLVQELFVIGKRLVFFFFLLLPALKKLTNSGQVFRSTKISEKRVKNRSRINDR